MRTGDYKDIFAVAVVLKDKINFRGSVGSGGLGGGGDGGNSCVGGTANTGSGGGDITIV